MQISKKIDFPVQLCYNIRLKEGIFILRVISGSAKRRKLKTPRGLAVRPTSDRVKEALFNMLGSTVLYCRFLDLFSGTGNIGIEALSRGAAGSTFVENNKNNIHIIKENLHITDLEDRARLIYRDAADALSLLGKEGQKFDIIFLDPPYHEDYEIKTLACIALCGVLEPGGMVVVESCGKHQLPRIIEGLEIVRQEKYGDTLLSFYCNKQKVGEGS
jgi:16S rRNA (guanine(966)-N(2))-methyltransferase RsmD